MKSHDQGVNQGQTFSQGYVFRTLLRENILHTRGREENVSGNVAAK